MTSSSFVAQWYQLVDDQGDILWGPAAVSSQAELEAALAAAGLFPSPDKHLQTAPAESGRWTAV